MVSNFTGLAEMLNDANIDRVMAIDEQWRIIAWNRTASELSGISAQELLGQNLLEVFPQYLQDRELMQSIELAFSGVKNFVGAQQDTFNRHHYENHFIPLRDTGNRVIGVMNIMHDVALRIEAEQQVLKLNIALSRKEDELKRMTDELSTINHITSHNIKEPVRKVYTSIELLVRVEGKLLSDGGKANLRRIQSSLTRMNLLLEDLLVLGRINNKGQKEEQVDLNNALMQASKILESKLSNQDVTIVADRLPTISGYPEMICFLFYHILNHAIRFPCEGSPFIIRISHSITGTGGINDTHNSFIDMNFEDNGTGVSLEEIVGLFDIPGAAPQKYVSSGISLAICRKIMSVHEGYLKIQAEPGTGTTFHCCFPAGPDETQ